MSAQPPPFCVRTAFQSWGDLAATVRSFPALSALAALAGAATSLSNMDLAAFDDPTAAGVIRTLGATVIEALFATPLLLAAHRLVILADRTSTLGSTVAKPRFWRFFLLSAGLLVLLYVPLLLARWSQSTSTAAVAALLLGMIGSAASGLLLSLLFPAIAVDAPGAGVGNAVADLWGKVWSIFFSGLLAVLPVAVAASVLGMIRAAFVEDSEGLAARLAAAPFEGAMTAATYLLLVFVASRYFVARANRLTQPGATAG